MPLSAGAPRHAALREAIHPVWADNFRAYGARKVWHALLRQGGSVARCTIERLMQQLFSAPEGA